jgi:uncharacterized membrane protein
VGLPIGGGGFAPSNLCDVLPERSLPVLGPSTRVGFTAAATAWPAFVLAMSSLVAFAWILHTQLQRLYGLTAPVWDLGQGQQLIWSLANGHGWTSSFELGHNFLGVHLELVFLPIAGVERLWLSPAVPLVFSAIGLAATAPAGFLMLRALLPPRPASTWLAMALSAPIPFWAATQEAARDQFHPENLALALAMLAAWAGLRQKSWLFWTLVVALVSCKEDQTYTALVIGFLIWSLGAPAMKAHGKRVMIFAVAWLLLGSAIQELIRGPGTSPVLSYYSWFFEGGRNFFVIAASRPDPWLALAGLLISLLGLPLFAPRWLLFAIPPLAANLLSSHDPQERLQLHYALLVMFPLIVAAGFGARRLLVQPAFGAWHMPAPALVGFAAPALIVGFVAGGLPPALGAESWLYQRPPAVDRLLSATAVIPRGAPVYADDGAAVWLTDRAQIWILYDHPQPDHYVVIDRQAWGHRGDRVASRADAIALMSATGRRLLVDDGRFQVWSPTGS